MDENTAQNKEAEELAKLEQELKSITPSPTTQTPPPPPATSPLRKPVSPEPVKPPVSPELKGTKVMMVALGLLVLSLVGVGAYFFGTKSSGQKACTLEAKICPDGTSVGRTGPNCEFAPCSTFEATLSPTESANPTPTASGSATPTTTSPSTPTATPSASPQ